jgi:hypothetical protein
MTVPRVGGLDIDQDLAFQKKWWRFQSIARGALFAVLAVASLGLLGHGPLDRATAGQPGFSVDYHRFIHYQTDTRLVVRLGPEAYQGRQAVVWIDRQFLDRVELTRVVPEPERRAAGVGRVLFVFNVADPGKPVEVAFQFLSDTYGPLQARLGTPWGQEATLGYFSYP